MPPKKDTKLKDKKVRKKAQGKAAAAKGKLKTPGRGAGRGAGAAGRGAKSAGRGGSGQQSKKPWFLRGIFAKGTASQRAAQQEAEKSKAEQAKAKSGKLRMVKVKGGKVVKALPSSKSNSSKSRLLKAETSREEAGAEDVARPLGSGAMVVYTGAQGDAGGSDPQTSSIRPKGKGKQSTKQGSAEAAEDSKQEKSSKLGKGKGKGKKAKGSKADGKGIKRLREDSVPTSKESKPKKTWYDGKSKELLLRCFEKELALTLKIFFTDQDVLSRRRCSYFRRNYLEVPELKDDCEAVLEEINQMAGPRVEEAIVKSGKEGVDQTLLEPQMLKVEEQRGFMKMQWPAFWASLGDRVDYRRGFLGRTGRFGSGTAGAIRAALADWWYEDIRAWVVRAEQSISSSQMSRLLFNGRDDHVELKVSGMGRTGNLVLAETDGLEVMASLVDERLRGKLSTDIIHRDVPMPWMFRITDGLRKTRAELLLKRVLEMEPEPGQEVDIPPEKKIFLKSVTDSASRDGGDVRWLNRLIELKAELGLIPAREAGDIVQERNLCLPYARVASSDQAFESDDWFELLPTPFLVGSIPAPEDEPLLKHADTGRNLIELDFLEGNGVERVCRVEVMARVTNDWKRPYAVIWQGDVGGAEGSEAAASQS